MLFSRKRNNKDKERLLKTAAGLLQRFLSYGFLVIILCLIGYVEIGNASSIGLGGFPSIEVNAGTTKNECILVKNRGEAKKDALIYEGRSFKKENDSYVSSKPWIEEVGRISVEGYEEREFCFTIKVPFEISNGDYLGFLAAEEVDSESDISNENSGAKVKIRMIRKIQISVLNGNTKKPQNNTTETITPSVKIEKNREKNVEKEIIATSEPAIEIDHNKKKTKIDEGEKRGYFTNTMIWIWIAWIVFIIAIMKRIKPKRKHK